MTNQNLACSVSTNQIANQRALRKERNSEEPCIALKILEKIQTEYIQTLNFKGDQSEPRMFFFYQSKSSEKRKTFWRTLYRSSNSGKRRSDGIDKLLILEVTNQNPACSFSTNQSALRKVRHFEEPCIDLQILEKEDQTE